MSLSYAHGAHDQPLLGETIGENLERTVARVPDSDALVSVHQDARYTYAEFIDAIDRLASGTLAAGPGRGLPVGEWIPDPARRRGRPFASAPIGADVWHVSPCTR